MAVVTEFDEWSHKKNKKKESKLKETVKNSQTYFILVRGERERERERELSLIHISEPTRLA